jgi:outer membrane protein assembly factor BamB
MKQQTIPFVVTVLLAFGSSLAHGDWPEFRGPTGDGHVADGDSAGNLPLEWSETENVRWKTAIPHLGWSTPVVLDGQVWLTAATEDGHDFYAVCVDADSGDVLHNVHLFHSDEPEPLGNNLNCYASPSPAIEPGRVYVHFGSFGTACLDTSTGEVLWKRDDLRCRHYRGPSSSVVLFDPGSVPIFAESGSIADSGSVPIFGSEKMGTDPLATKQAPHGLVILTLDGADLQYVIALDKATGETVWKTDRDVEWNDQNLTGEYAKYAHLAREGDFRKAHSTPLVVTADDKLQLLSGGAKATFSYDPRTGQEYWRVHYDDWSVAPRPIYEDGTAYIVTGLMHPELWAVSTDGTGDVTESHVRWRLKQGVAKTASPVLVDGLIYMVSDDGIASCVDAESGEVVWKKRLGGRYASSPIYAAGTRSSGSRLYFFNQDGQTTVLQPGREYELLATNALDDGFMASPAVADGALFLRTKSHLYRIDESP